VDLTLQTYITDISFFVKVPDDDNLGRLAKTEYKHTILITNKIEGKTTLS